MKNSVFFCFVFLIFEFSFATVSEPEAISHFLEKNETYYYSFYKDIHQNPELSGEERRTAEKVAEEFRRIGLDVITGLGGHGVVGVLENGEGPVGLIRGDMDALPIQEETGLPFASNVPGVYHACGHDMHTTLLVSLAGFFKNNLGSWNGTLYFLAQPAEETLSGANAMIEDGLFQKIRKPDYALAVHGDSRYPVGRVGSVSGNGLASNDFVDVTFNGKGGHGARPHGTIDPILLGANYILKIQEIVSREIAAHKPAVISVGSIHAGTKHNIIPYKSKLQLTYRTYDDDVRSYIMERLRKIAEDLSEAHRADPPTFSNSAGVPPTYNDPQLFNRFQQIVADGKIPDAEWVELQPTMSAEDFGVFSKTGNFPSLFLWIGSQNPAAPRPWPYVHTSKYSPDFKGFWSMAFQSVSNLVIEIAKDNTVTKIE